MSIWIIFIIGISLSMDAFSLSLAYGTLDIKEKDMERHVCGKDKFFKRFCEVEE